MQLRRIRGLFYLFALNLTGLWVLASVLDYFGLVRVSRFINMDLFFYIIAAAAFLALLVDLRIDRHVLVVKGVSLGFQVTLIVFLLVLLVREFWGFNFPYLFHLMGVVIGLGALEILTSEKQLDEE